MSEENILIKDGFTFYNLIKTLSSISDEVPLLFDPKNKVLNMLFMDSHRICLINVDIRINDINTNYLKTFLNVSKVEINGSIPCKKIYIYLKDFEMLLQVKKGAEKTIKICFDDKSKLLIEKRIPNSLQLIKKSLMYLDVEHDEISIHGLQSIVYPNQITIGKTVLEDMFYESNKYSDLCKIKTNKEGICFKETGIIGKYEAFYPCDDLESCHCESTEKSAYSYVFLNVIKKFLAIMESGDSIDIYHKTDTALKVVIIFKKINATVTYYVAQQVKESVLNNSNNEF